MLRSICQRYVQPARRGGLGRYRPGGRAPGGLLDHVDDLQFDPSACLLQTVDLTADKASDMGAVRAAIVFSEPDWLFPVIVNIDAVYVVNPSIPIVVLIRCPC